MQTTRNKSSGRPGGNRPRNPQLRRPGSRGVRWWRVVGISALVLVGLGVMAALALHIRLQQGPIPVDFLLRPLEASINRGIAPLRMQIGRTVLRYEEKSFGLALRLNDIRITDETGQPVASAPFAAIGISSRALLQGTLAPSRIELLQPRLLLTVDRENRISFRAARAADSSAEDGTATLAAEPASPPLQVEAIVNLALAQALAGSSGTRTSELQSFGLRDALLVLDFQGRRSIWGVPALVVRRVAGKDGARATARGTLVGSSGTSEFDAQIRRAPAGNYEIGMSVQDFVPADLGQALPPLGVLKGLDLAVSTKSQIVLAASGSIQSAEAEFSASPAAISTLAPCSAPFVFDSGVLGLRYSGEAGDVEILPSLLASNLGRARIAGRLVPPGPGNSSGWRYDVNLSDATLGTGDGGLAPLAIPQARLRGMYDPVNELFTLDRLHVPLGDGAVDIAGRMTPQIGVLFEAALSRIDSAMMKRAWPSCIGEAARAWFRKNLHAGVITQATARFAVPPADPNATQFELSGSASNLSFSSADKLPPTEAAAARFELKGGRYQITAPVSSLALTPDHVLTVRNGSFTIPDIDAPVAQGVLNGEISSTVETAARFFRSEALRTLGNELDLPAGMSGQQTGNWQISFPLQDALAFSDFDLRGKVKVKNLKEESADNSKPRIDGGALDIDVGDGSLTVAGVILVNGVDFQLAGKRPIGAPGQTASTLSLTATLDDAARDQLGININHMVRGDIAVVAELTAPGPVNSAAPPSMRVKADLSGAELVLDTMAWRKPPGAPATLSVVVVPQADGSTHLDDFRLIGDAVGIGGKLVLDRQRRLQSFSFPDFSIDVITRLRLEGKRRADNVIDIKAKGETFDGRKLFRALFSAGRVTDRDLPAPRDTEGIDLGVEIGTMVGAEDVSIRQVVAKLSRRRGKLTAMEASGLLDGGGGIAARVVGADNGARVLIAETKDAGRAFKLVGLYRNIEGGEASLRVEMDSGSRTEKSGILWARRFVVLGDPVVDEVLRGNDHSDAIPQPAVKGRKGAIQRERLEFSNMRVPFRVGEGRLNLLDSFINGPILGATIRGTVDFERRDVRLAGTYVPLFGLNAMLSGVPILGDLLIGRSGEGVFGITFAINGQLDRPQVLVNPISMVAPGIFRQMFEFDPNMTLETGDKPPKPRRKPKPQGISSDPPALAPAVQPSIGEAMPVETAPPKKTGAPATGKPAP